MSTLVSQVINGAGTGENLTGLGSTSGIQTQAFVTNTFLTTRTAVNKLELLGVEGQAFVFHPTDWLAVETTTVGTGGAYLLAEAGAPIDRIARKLWGVPVVLSTAATPGTAYLLGQDAVALFTDDQGVRVEWAMVSDDFSRNQVRARCEGRFALAVARPMGVVKIALA
jgi:HK97 family phage major capsid protein